VETIALQNNTNIDIRRRRKMLMDMADDTIQTNKMAGHHNNKK
jgi:hypothetical protein